MLPAIGSLTVLGLCLGALLGVAARYLRVEGNPLAMEIEGMLPGTNCGQCGYPGCTTAAEVLAQGEAPVTLCPPGGRGLASELAGKLGVTANLSDMEDKAPAVAFINEALCVGCTKCFKRCPTDAIVGSSRQMHSVISDACTGCEQCVDICPTECVTMRPIPATLQNWYWPKPAIAA
ncbi:MAG: RnfABCDGE type electron transport complex subunit B [Magnetospiraceae bacterium]